MWKFLDRSKCRYDQVVKEFTSALQLSVDLSGRKEVNDACLEALVEAGVTLKELNLSGTVVSAKGLAALAKECPSLLLKCDLSPNDGMRVQDMAYIATQVPVEE